MKEQENRRATELYSLIERNLEVLTENAAMRRPEKWVSQAYSSHLNIILNDVRTLFDGVPGQRYLTKIPAGVDVRVLDVILILSGYIAFLDERID